MNQDGELKSPATVMSCSGTPSPDNDFCRDIDGKSDNLIGPIVVAFLATVSVGDHDRKGSMPLTMIVVELTYL